jgi:hypothetical protein
MWINMKLKFQVLTNQNKGLYILVFNILQVFWHSLIHANISIFLSSLMIGDMIEAKFSMDHL